MRHTSLMSTIEAAGYAMAPSEEDMAEEFTQPEQALRNGHVEAANKERRAPTLMRLNRSLVVVELGRVHLDAARSHWLRDVLTGWWAPRAPA